MNIAALLKACARRSTLKSSAPLAALLRKNLDAAAHEAATSPLNLRPPPTEGQRSAGNYKMGHATISGLAITIENPAGSHRRPEWPPMVAHYGYIKGTEGADGDHVDVFVRPSTPEDWTGTVFVIDQSNADGSFDEHKCMLGYDDERIATRAYLAHYTKEWKLGPVTAMELDEFKTWLASDTTEPIEKDGGGAGASGGASGPGWTQSTSATSGITAYGNTGRRRKKKAKPVAKIRISATTI